MREGWSELGGWSREEMEAAEEEMRRGEGSDAYGLQISQLGEWVCDACLEGYLGGGVGDYSELRSGYVAPYPGNPWIGRSRDLSWMRKGPIGVTRREALLAAEEAKAAARAAEKAARAAEGGKGGGSGRQSREARRRKGSSSRGGVRTARREDEEPEPGEGRVGKGGRGRRSMTASSTAHKGPLSAVPFVVLVRASLLKERKKTDNPREGWEDGTPPPHRDFKEGTVWC